MPETPREFFDLPEAAEFCRLSEDYLRRSNCPRIKKGSRIVFHIADLRAFMLADRRPSLEGAAA